MPITKEALELAIKAVEESIARIDRGVLLFGSLVAIGVTGETILGVRHWIKDGQLRDLRSIESHMHENETLSLQGKIADANARAKGAEALVASADAASRDAVAKVATAEARIKEAEARAAEAKLELEKFKMPRTIGLVGQERMVKALEVFPGTPFDLTVGSDSESVDLMRIVQSVLVRAGWKQVAADGAIGLSNSNPLIGITLSSGILLSSA
ncbi:MAG: hypothetical protein ABSA59_15730 [Terriglobia bacterium]|jgi:hypothetical protein